MVALPPIYPITNRIINLTDLGGLALYAHIVFRARISESKLFTLLRREWTSECKIGQHQNCDVFQFNSLISFRFRFVAAPSPVTQIPAMNNNLLRDNSGSRRRQRPGTNSVAFRYELIKYAYINAIHSIDQIGIISHRFACERTCDEWQSASVACDRKGAHRRHSRHAVNREIPLLHFHIFFLAAIVRSPGLWHATFADGRQLCRFFFNYKSVQWLLRANQCIRLRNSIIILFIDVTPNRFALQTTAPMSKPSTRSENI